ncbi:uncharacterized protein BJ212DRAFT_1482917 [Suillus subaureus]|uniref:Uncharacterized protein n=1 Tax=Suillus subaureus TaxID=48587 RepID=A0A9P7E7P0_9AGAM|nr:uncharacterized protein BJ212DRAFT_1482917 [Suillus subaureus]KAG1812857.1 hypothetical protein BJ212DRAFT_1482917 [Suillus subaureus]
MSSTTLPLTVDCSEKLNVHGNCIAMDIKNILIDWPTYMVKFTPKKPGPVKLMIHFKNASKGVWVEDEDSDTKTVTVTTCKSSSTCASTTHDADTTLVSDMPSESKDDMQLVSTTPVHFISIPKNPSTLKKCKFRDEDCHIPHARHRSHHIPTLSGPISGPHIQLIPGSPILSTLCTFHPARHLDFTSSQILDYIHHLTYLSPVSALPSRSPDLWTSRY